MGILAKLSQKCSKLGLFVEFYNFPKKKCPKFSFFFRKIPVFHYFFLCFCEMLLFFPPQKRPKFYFFPVKVLYFTIFFGVFVKCYYIFPKKGPNLTFFHVKVPYFTIFVDPIFPKPSQWEVWGAPSFFSYCLRKKASD